MKDDFEKKDISDSTGHASEDEQHVAEDTAGLSGENTEQQSDSAPGDGQAADSAQEGSTVYRYSGSQLYRSQETDGYGQGAGSGYGQGGYSGTGGSYGTGSGYGQSTGGSYGTGTGGSYGQNANGSYGQSGYNGAGGSYGTGAGAGGYGQSAGSSYGQSAGGSYGQSGYSGAGGSYSQGTGGGYGQSSNSSYGQGTGGNYGAGGSYSTGSSYGQGTGSSYGTGSGYGQGAGGSYGGYGQSSNGSYGQSGYNSANGGYSQSTNGAYGGAGGSYAQGGSSGKPVKKKKRRFVIDGWKKAVCYGLIFGLVAGVVFEGIHLAGNALASRKNQGNGSNERVVNVVKTSSEEVDTIGMEGVSDIVREVMPSIVAVNTVIEEQMRDWFGRTYSQEGEGAGTGFIFSEDGEYLYLATNFHVIENSKEISVVFNDDSSVPAEIRGYDENADVAVLLVKLSDLSDETKNAIKVAVIGDSDALEAGNGSIAIGNALGYGQSVTTGAISAVERTVQLTDGEMTLIQTEAAINPGNSGGPLLNDRGEVIGINTVKYSETKVEGMGFAIPINSAMETINDILSGKVASKSDTVYFGIRGGTVSEALAQEIGCPQGVYVGYVYQGSAAERAGLQVDDIITEFDGTAITTFEELQACLAKHRPGDRVDLVVYEPDSRGGYSESQKLTTILGSMEEAPDEY